MNADNAEQVSEPRILPMHYIATATVTFDYDSRDGLVTSEDAARADLMDVLPGLSPDAFTIKVTSEPIKPNITNQRVLRLARGLLSDDGENPEYDRAITELVTGLFGLSMDVKFKVAHLLGVKGEALRLLSDSIGDES